MFGAKHDIKYRLQRCGRIIESHYCLRGLRRLDEWTMGMWGQREIYNEIYSILNDYVNEHEMLFLNGMKLLV